MSATHYPAFPVDHEFVRPGATPDEMRVACGMTLRDYFAAAAVPALIARDTEQGREELEADGEFPATPNLWTYSDSYNEIAKAAYALADAMLAARKEVRHD